MAKETLAHLAWLAALGVSLTGALAHAQSDVKTTISGFGTLVGTVTDERDIQFKTGPIQDVGATDSGLDFGVDSRFGLQGRFDFGNSMTFTAQMIAQRYEDEDFHPRVEWAYGQYSGFSGLDLRIGRVVLPAFMVSDSRFVSYSLPGVRVPSVVYGMMPASTSDGLQAIYSRRVSGINWTLTTTAGSSKMNNGQIDQVKNVAIGAEIGNWGVRYGVLTSNTTLILPGLQTFHFKDKFQNIGVQYDNGDYFGAFEYVDRKTNPSYFGMNGWYLSGGIRFGQWAPYAVVSSMNGKSGNVQGRTLGGSAVTVISPMRNTRGNAIGVRYDIASNVALKAEIGRYKGASPFTFWPSPRNRQELTAASVGLDFVF